MTSRINEYTAGFGDAPRDLRQERERRRRRFAAEHQPGDIVRGTPLRPGPDKLTWVDIDGHPLLADIGSPEGFPLLSFVVEAVEPEIILKLRPGPAPVTPARAAALYAAARAAMDERLAADLWPGLSPDASRSERRDAFFQHLVESPEARERAQALAGALGLLAPALHRFAALNKARAARLAHLPWLEAGARETDCLILLSENPATMDGPEESAPYALDPDQFPVRFSVRFPGQGVTVRLLYGCALPGPGRVLCEVDARPAALSARLFAEEPHALRKYMRARGATCLLAPPGARLDHLGPLPGGATDPLALLTAEVVASRLNRTV